MHEMSIALEIARIVEERLDEAGVDASTLVEVGIDIGDDGGLEPANLEFCLTAVLATPPFRRARPVLERRPGADLQVTYLEVDDDRPND